jgi:hypothetical protein
MAQIEVTGWARTALLAVGAGVGVLITAGILHLAKEWGLIK